MWKSKMQKTMALLTAEAEYYSASAAGCEVLYLRALLDSLTGRFKQKKPTPIYEDNTACIEWGNNVICGRERAKHIDIQNWCSLWTTRRRWSLTGTESCGSPSEHVGPSISCTLLWRSTATSDSPSGQHALPCMLASKVMTRMRALHSSPARDAP
jgi:hypothetical protein